MNKDILKVLQAVMKQSSAQELWDNIKRIEEAIEEAEEGVEALEDIVVQMLAEDEDKSLESMKEVAKTKNLPEPGEGGFIKRFMGLSFSSSVGEGTTQTKGARGKKKACDYLPTEEEISKINDLTNIDIDPQAVFVFTLESAGQEVDRSHDQFTLKALKEMAEMSVDKPFLRNHDWSTESVIGKIFDATVKNKTLIQKVYVPNTAKNEDMIDGILSGIYNKVSVGFALDPAEYVCSSCTKSLYSRDCPHYPGSKDAKGELVIAQIKGVADYFEISNVAVPAQPKAGIRRSAQKSVETESEDLSIDKILNENLEGASTLVDQPEVKAVEPELEPVAEPQAEEPVVEEKSAEAPEAEQPKVEDPTEKILAMLAAMQEEINSLKSAPPVVKEVVAEEKSIEEIVREELVNKSAIDSQPVTVDLKSPGWSKAFINTLFAKPNNQ